MFFRVTPAVAFTNFKELDLQARGDEVVWEVYRPPQSELLFHLTIGLLGSERLAASLEAGVATGIDSTPLRLKFLNCAPYWNEKEVESLTPAFCRLRVHGVGFQDDFGYWESTTILIVSNRIANHLKQYKMNETLIQPISPDQLEAEFAGYRFGCVGCNSDDGAKLICCNERFSICIDCISDLVANFDTLQSDDAECDLCKDREVVRCYRIGVASICSSHANIEFFQDAAEYHRQAAGSNGTG